MMSDYSSSPTPEALVQDAREGSSVPPPNTTASNLDPDHPAVSFNTPIPRMDATTPAETSPTTIATTTTTTDPAKPPSPSSLPPLEPIPTPTPDPPTQSRRCFVCLTDEDDESTSPTPWVNPCPCSLAAHQSCMLDFVDDCERERRPLRCPICKYPIKISQPFDPAIWVSRKLQEMLSGASPYLLAGIITASTLAGSASYGFGALAVFAGPRAALGVLWDGRGDGVVAGIEGVVGDIMMGSEGRRPWWLRVAWGPVLHLPFVGPVLVLNKFLRSFGGVFSVPYFLTYVFVARLVPFEEMTRWPPNPYWCLSMFPLVRRTYFEVWRELFGGIEKRLDRQLRALSDERHEREQLEEQLFREQQREQQLQPAIHEHHGGGRDPLPGGLVNADARQAAVQPPAVAPRAGRPGRVGGAPAGQQPAPPRIQQPPRDHQPANWTDTLRDLLGVGEDDHDEIHAGDGMNGGNNLANNDDWEDVAEEPRHHGRNRRGHRRRERRHRRGLDVRVEIREDVLPGDHGHHNHHHNHGDFDDGDEPFVHGDLRDDALGNIDGMGGMGRGGGGGGAGGAPGREDDVPGWIDITNSISASLLFPGIAFLAGEALRLALPRGWTGRGARASLSPPSGGSTSSLGLVLGMFSVLRGGTGYCSGGAGLPAGIGSGLAAGAGGGGLLQERWGRSLVGGCVYVVLRDVFRLYVKWRAVRTLPKRKVRDVGKRDGWTVSMG